MDMDDGPLLDLSPFDGLKPESVTRLCTLFYVSDLPASGVAQLQAIEACIAAGDDRTAFSFDHLLHQLAGSAMQAGASLLGRTVRSYRQDPCALATLENIREMRRLLDGG